MKKISMLFYVLLMAISLSPVYALEESDIKCDKKANTTHYSFTKSYDSNSEAQTALEEFEQYVLSQRGIVSRKNITTKETENKFELINGTLYADDLETLNSSLTELKEQYQDTDNTKYEIIEDEIVTIETTTTSTEEDEGEIGKYYSEEEANQAKNDAEANNTEDYVVTCVIKKEEEFVETKTKEITQTFETMEEAEAAVLELKNEGYDIASVEINGFFVTVPGDDETLENEDKTVLENHVASLEEQGWTVTYNYTTREDVTGQEVTEIKQSFEDFAQAKNYADSLEDIFDYVNVEIKDESYTTVETDNIDQTFDTKAEAEAKVTELEDQGYTVTDKVISEVKTDEGDETTTGEGKYDTEENAHAALEEFLNNPDNETEEFYFTGTVKGPEFMGNYTESEINEKFSSKEEALNYINELEANGYEIINYEFINDKTTEEGRKEETYSTRAEAEAALAEFTREYPNNIQSNIEEIISGTVYDAITITEDMKIYQIGSTTFVIIKKGNEIFVWTEEELNAQAQAQFKNTYKQVASDPVLTGNAVASNRTKFIYGYNITYTTSNGKHFTFRLENGEVKIDMDSGAESRVVSGTFAPVNQYKLVVTGSKEVDAKEGTLTGTKKEKKLEYYYELVKKLKKYNLKANLSKEILNPKYTVEGTGTNDLKTLMYILNLSKTRDVTNYRIDGKATMDVYRPYWLVTYNSVETIYNTTISYSQNYTVNQIDINREYIAEGEGYYTEPEIVVPKTGINAVNYEYLIILSAALLAAVNVKYVLKKQNNN